MSLCMCVGALHAACPTSTHPSPEHHATPTFLTSSLTPCRLSAPHPGSLFPAVCDQWGQHPFNTIKELQDHLAARHEGRLMCQVCITANRK